MTAIQKVAPARPLFGAEKPDNSKKPPANDKPAPATADRVDVPKAERSPLIQGGILSGIGRGFRMYLSPRGIVELAADIACLVTGVTFFVPPFFAKHFVEGFIGANTWFQKDRTWPGFVRGAVNKDFYVEEFEQNRTVWGALKSFVTRKPDDFDIARFEVAQRAKQSAPPKK